eukprot:gene3671-2601_t
MPSCGCAAMGMQGRQKCPIGDRPISGWEAKRPTLNQKAVPRRDHPAPKEKKSPPATFRFL